MYLVASLGCEVGDLVQFGDVEGDGGGLVFTMLVDEGLQLFLPTTNDDDIGSFSDKARCQRFANAACCSDA